MNGSTNVERLANRLSPANEMASACCTAAFSAVEMTFVVGAVPLSTEHASAPTAASEMTARFIQRTPLSGQPDAGLFAAGSSGGGHASCDRRIRRQGGSLVDAAGIPQNPGFEAELLGGPDLVTDLRGGVARQPTAEREGLQIRPDQGRARETGTGKGVRQRQPDYLVGIRV